ncbi:Cthe_2314 family HEPN domain-containing protein [Photobacterium alginatilyticum]|uniref:Cthe-2314-like HEPN domain-containing protein n=1 Tax=Photobacterium alginatilyticum TaxID=1775171 RepID=A0ABW9YQZ0_9GAMM|nr:Cthe_2314 family HEPN domain-containing protein [Photobacterium alginatilyticum]NBI56317.1 hypothetical protein [Photobacterium alginatilyticum]
MLISNDSFSSLKVCYAKAVIKGLRETQGEKQSYTEYEKYSFDVMKRVIEVDAALDGLNIGLHYLEHEDLDLPVFRFSKVCVYHVENIISRLTTVEERMKLLVSTSLLKNNIRVASFKGKIQFDNLIDDFPVIKEKMGELSTIVSKYKTLRNEISHESSFTTSNVIVASTLEDTDIEIPIEHSEIKSEIISSTVSEFSELIVELDISIEAVVCALSEIYADLIIET